MLGECHREAEPIPEMTTFYIQRAAPHSPSLFDDMVLMSANVQPQHLQLIGRDARRSTGVRRKHVTEICGGTMPTITHHALDLPGAWWLPPCSTQR